MASPRGRYSDSPPRRYHSRSRSPPPRRDDRGPNESNVNPGNNLYVTGLSTRVTEQELLAHFEKEGRVTECRLVVDPRTRESRGFGFVTMAELEDAENCVKFLNRTTLQGRVIMVEKAKRKRARTPTPGEYLGVRGARDIGRGGRSGGGRYGGGRYDSRDDYRGDYRGRRSPEYAPYRGGGGRDRSPYSPYRGSRRSRSPPPRSPYYSRY